MVFGFTSLFSSTRTNGIKPPPPEPSKNVLGKRRRMQTHEEEVENCSDPTSSSKQSNSPPSISGLESGSAVSPPSTVTDSSKNGFPFGLASASTSTSPGLNSSSNIVNREQLDGRLWRVKDHNRILDDSAVGKRRKWNKSVGYDEDAFNSDRRRLAKPKSDLDLAASRSSPSKPSTPLATSLDSPADDFRFNLLKGKRPSLPISISPSPPATPKPTTQPPQTNGRQARHHFRSRSRGAQPYEEEEEEKDLVKGMSRANISTRNPSPTRHKNAQVNGHTHVPSNGRSIVNGSKRPVTQTNGHDPILWPNSPVLSDGAFPFPISRSFHLQEQDSSDNDSSFDAPPGSGKRGILGKQNKVTVMSKRREQTRRDQAKSFRNPMFDASHHNKVKNRDAAKAARLLQRSNRQQQHDANQSPYYQPKPPKRPLPTMPSDVLSFETFQELLDSRRIYDPPAANTRSRKQPLWSKQLLGKNKRIPVQEKYFVDSLIGHANKAIASIPRPSLPQYDTLLDKIRKEDKVFEPRQKKRKFRAALEPEQQRKLQEFRRESFSKSITNGSVTGRDIRTLSPGTWLNDEIVNYYGAMIVERSKSRADQIKKRREAEKSANAEKKAFKLEAEGTHDVQYLDTHVFSSFFWTSLTGKGYSGVRRWSKKFDLFSKEMIVIPINLSNVHWVCAAINLRKKRFEFYDSMGRDNPQIYEVLRDYLKAEHKDKKGKDIDLDEWEDYFDPDVPRQNNGVDCGVFTCQFAESLSRADDGFDFDHEHTAYLRTKMGYEIGTAKFLEEEWD